MSDSLNSRDRGRTEASARPVTSVAANTVGLKVSVLIRVGVIYFWRYPQLVNLLSLIAILIWINLESQKRRNNGISLEASLSHLVMWQVVSCQSCPKLPAYT